MNVIVVGGADSLIQGSFGQKLSRHGIQVEWHESQPARLDALPDAAEGVVIIKDMVSHALSGSAISLAKMKGIPFVQVTRKFSHAYPILRDSGFLKNVAALEAIKGQAANTPTPITPEAKKEFTMPVSNPTLPAVSPDDVQEAIDLIFREDPYTAKFPKLFGQRLYDLTQHTLPDAEVQKAVALKLNSLWNMTGKLRDPAVRDARTQLRQRWMVAFMKDVFHKTNRLPTFADINAEARSYFGATLEAGVIRGYQKIVQADLQVAAPAPTPPPVVETPAPKDDPWDGVNNQIALLTQQVDAMQTLIQTLLDNQNKLASQTNAIGMNVTDARDRIATLEAAPQPTQQEQVVPQTTLAQALAELAAHGLTLKIEAK